MGRLAGLVADPLEDRVRGIAEEDQLDGPVSVEPDQGWAAPIATAGGGPHREAMDEERRQQPMGGTGGHREVAGRLGHAEGAVCTRERAEQLQGGPDGPKFSCRPVSISHSGMQFDRIRGRWSQYRDRIMRTKPDHSAMKKV